MEIGKEKLNTLTEKRFRIFLMMMRIGGFPVYMDRVPYYQIIYNVTMDICIYITYFGTVMDVIVNIDDLQMAMKSFRMVLTITICIWLQLNIRFFSSKINHVIHITESFIWEDLPTRDPDTGHLSKTGWILHIQITVRNVAVFSSIFHMLQSVTRMIVAGELIFKATYPFDASVSPAYEIIYVIQVLATCQCECSFLGYMLGYAILVFIASSQLEKLQENLSKIKQGTITALNVSDMNSNYYEIEHFRILDVKKSDIQSSLNECIRHHQKIIEFLQALEDVLNVTVCGVFLTISVAMCFLVFSVITSWGDYVDILQAIYVYLLIVGCVFVFCSLGSELEESVEKVKEAVWSCDWVGAPIPFQRCIIPIIAITSKGFNLTAGKFVPISNTTLLNMIKESMSFFMFLLTMKDKNEQSKDKNVM